jgi:hypothetical protein
LSAFPVIKDKALGLFSSISKALFGKNNPAKSGNKFADQLNTSFSPWVQQGGQGMAQYANVLGLGGEGAQDEALGNWWDSSGGDFLMNQGMDQIMGNRAAGGLLRSGGTGKAIENYRSGLASTKLGEYMGLLDNMNKNALGAGNIIANAGQTSTGANKSGGGLGKVIGLATSIFSDSRLKYDIEKIGEEADGLGRYRYRYLWDETPREGVMADEVAELRPWALGPVVNGFATVNYGAL